MRHFGKEKPSILDDSIDRILKRMQKVEPDTEEYKQMLVHLERLIRLKNEDRKNRISPDTMAIVAGNLLGILIIVGYEHGHVMVSRGLAFVLRAK